MVTTIRIPLPTRERKQEEGPLTGRGGKAERSFGVVLERVGGGMHYFRSKKEVRRLHNFYGLVLEKRGGRDVAKKERGEEWGGLLLLYLAS